MTWARRGKYYEVPGALYPFDIRHDPADRAFVKRELDGRVRVRVRHQPDLSDGVVVVGSDGVPRESGGGSGGCR